MGIESYQSVEARLTRVANQTAETDGIVHKGFDDTEGVNPSAETVGQYGQNPTGFAHGNNINMGEDLPEDIITGDEVENGKVWFHETPAGHLIQYNDTPANERIMFRHKSGAGINIGPDGSIIISSARRVEIVEEDYILKVGDGTLSFGGNLKIDVQGDLDINVGGDFNVNSKTKTETVKGNYTTKVSGGNHSTYIDGNESKITTQVASHTYLNDHTVGVKGKSELVAANGHEMSVKGDLVLSGSEQLVMSSPDVNLASDNLSVFGGSGTIGGTGVVVSAQGAVFEEGVTAPTFHGDLKGTAEKAITSDVTNSQNYSDPDTDAGSAGNQGSASGYTVNEVAQPAITKPTSDNVSDYLSNSNKGVREVQVDEGDVIKNALNNMDNTGGATNFDLDTALVRRKLKEPSYAIDNKFITKAIADNAASPDVVKETPAGIDQAVDVSNPVVRGKTPMGNVAPHTVSKKIKGPR